MRFSILLESLPEELSVIHWIPESAGGDPVIRGLTYDSRSVAPGDLFFALRGTDHDGHVYIERAIELGAVAVVVEEEPAAERLSGRAAAVVPDSRRALGPIAARFYGEPAREVDMIGITGTNGKTSTSYLIESILSRAGHRTGLVGTVEIRYAGEKHSAVNTTPESLDLQQTLRAMCTRNIEKVVMEVSSHGLELERVHGCVFNVAAVTNITQDHLDFHGDMDSYLTSKTLLFNKYLAPNGHAVINVDDPSSDRFVAAARERGAHVIRVSRDANSEAEVRLLEADIALQGSRVRIALPSGELALELPLLGDFNLENLLVACGVCVGLDVAPEHIAEGVAVCPQVPGRVEVVRIDGGESLPTVIVDYAHTPDAVEKLLRAVRPLCQGRLITVFGCGGNRDRAKRPLMAEAVARLSDRAIATSDNPRREDPDAILADVEQGLSGLEHVAPDQLDSRDASYTLIRDRREAIELAVSIAGPADTVVLAGKGHEDYQIVGTQKLPFDDRKEARIALRARVQS